MSLSCFLRDLALYRKNYLSFLSVGNRHWINAGIAEAIPCVEFKVKIEPSKDYVMILGSDKPLLFLI